MHRRSQYRGRVSKGVSRQSSIERLRWHVGLWCRCSVSIRKRIKCPGALKTEAQIGPNIQPATRHGRSLVALDWQLLSIRAVARACAPPPPVRAEVGRQLSQHRMAVCRLNVLGRHRCLRIERWASIIAASNIVAMGQPRSWWSKYPTWRRRRCSNLLLTGAPIELIGYLCVFTPPALLSCSLSPCPYQESNECKSREPSNGYADDTLFRQSPGRRSGAGGGRNDI